MKSATTTRQLATRDRRVTRVTALLPISSLLLAIIMAVMLLAGLSGPVAAPGRAKAGVLVAANGRIAHIALASSLPGDCDNDGLDSDYYTSDLTGVDCPSSVPDGAVSAAELYGGSNPSEACFSCALTKVGSRSGVTKGPVAKRGDPVDTLTGDLSETWNGFSIPAVGNPINLKLTYDAQSAQGELAGGATYGGEFGFGWHTAGAMSLTWSSGSSATVYQSNGSQVTFDQLTSLANCVKQTPAQYPRTVGGSAYDFCGYPRVDAEIGYISAVGSWDFWRQGGLQATYSFNIYGQLAYTGNIHNTNYTSYTYDVAPGTGACPSSSTYAWLNNCTVITDAAGRHFVYGLTADGLVDEVWDPMGREYTFGYVSAGTGPSGKSAVSLASASDPQGDTTSFSYAGGSSTPYADDLVALSDPMGNTTSFTYNSSGQVASETAPPASSDSVGVLGSTPSYTTKFDYSCPPSCTSPNTQFVMTTASNGDIVADCYADGVLGATVLGAPATLSNHPTKICTTSPLPAPAATWFFSHDPKTLLPSGVYDPTGAVTQTIYTTDSTTGLLQSKETTGPTGYVTLSVYNSSTGSNAFDERCWSAKSASVSNLPSSPSCGSVPASSSNLAVTSYTYDPLGDLVARTDPMGNTTKWTYDVDQDGDSTLPGGDTDNDLSEDAPVALPQSMTDPMGNVTTYAYDLYGQIGRQTNALGDTTIYDYNTDGQLTAVVPPNGNASGANPAAFETTYAYDTAGYLESVTAPGGRTTSYSYDANGQLLSVTDPVGNVTTNAYDQEGRLCWTYDLSGSPAPACASPPTGATRYYYVDATSARDHVSDQNGNTTYYDYANVAYPSTPTLVTDALGNTTSYVLDGDGRVCASGPGNAYSGTTPPTCASPNLTKATLTTYDYSSNVTSTTDPSGYVTSYAYADPLRADLVTTKTVGPLGASTDFVTTYSYNEDGQLAKRTDPLGNVTYHLYNADSKTEEVVTSISGPSQAYLGLAYQASYTYDAAGRHIATSSIYQLPNGAESATMTSTYTYDPSGNLTSYSGPNGLSVSYAYNPDNEVSCIAYPVSTSPSCASSPSATNTVVTRSYNQDGQLSSPTDWLGNTTSFSYNGRGELSGITYPSSTGSSVSLAHDPYGNITSETMVSSLGTTTSSWSYDKDELRATNSSAQATYSYNQRLELTATGSNTYGYLSNGAPASVTPSGGSATTYAYGTRMPYLSSASSPSGTTTFTNNKDGERILTTPPSGTGSQIGYSYDPYGNMCWSGPSSASGDCGQAPSGAVTYTYNTAGLRMTTTSPAGTVARFSWQTQGVSVPRIMTDSTNAFIYGPSLGGNVAPVEQISLAGGAPTFVASKPSGPELWFGATGSVTALTGFSAYGTETSYGPTVTIHVPVGKAETTRVLFE